MADIKPLILPRALVDAVLGFIIGREREKSGTPAGDRTFSLRLHGGRSGGSDLVVTIVLKTRRGETRHLASFGTRCAAERQMNQ